MNAQEARIPFPWLVFNEKVKVNSVFLRDSTGVSDSVVLLFGGSVSSGGLVNLYFLCRPCITFNYTTFFLMLYIHNFLGRPHENAGWILGVFHEARVGYYVS